MSFISDQELTNLRLRADLVQVIGEKIPLKKAGRNFKGLCPFHSEKTPSFMVQPDKQIFHCFGCGEGGDVFSFLMKYEGLEFIEAVERLAEQFGVVLTRTGADGDEVRRTRTEKELLFKINALAERYFHEHLVREGAGEKAREYLKGRTVREEMIQEMRLGYAPGAGKGLAQLFLNKGVPMEKAQGLGLVRRGEAGDFYDFFRDRLVFPILSAEGKVLGFSGRVLSDAAQPKYLNSPESAVYRKSDSLLGIKTARPAIRELDQVLLVEGNFDLLRLQQEGLKNAVAPLGTALTELQVKILARLTRNFILIFDGDEAGERAAFRALDIFLPLGILPRVVLLPLGEDPDSFVKRQGSEALRRLISVSPYLLEVRIDHLFEKEGKDPQKKAQVLHLIVELLRLLPGEIEKRLSIQRVAARFGFSEEVLLRETFTKVQKRGNARNFSAGLSDDRMSPAGLAGSPIPPVEKFLLEILLSGRDVPQTFFQEIERTDFSHPISGEIWGILSEDYLAHGSLDVGRVLSAIPDGTVRKLLTELTLRGSRWQEEGGKAAADCVRQMRVQRMRGRLKELSQEIRKAEMGQDVAKMNELMSQKNRLVQEMNQGLNQEMKKPGSLH